MTTRREEATDWDGTVGRDSGNSGTAIPEFRTDLLFEEKKTDDERFPLYISYVCTVAMESFVFYCKWIC